MGDYARVRRLWGLAGDQKSAAGRYSELGKTGEFGGRSRNPPASTHKPHYAKAGVAFKSRSTRLKAF
jgi:hypothetical protein